LATVSTNQQPDRQNGNLLIEVALAMVLLSVSLTAVASVLGSSLKASTQSKQLNHGARFLEAVLSSLDEQSNAALLAMNGNVFYERGTAAQSAHRIDLAATRSGIDGVDVVIVMRRHPTGEEVARVGTYRASR
jgi:Tfp pilus assembly protein PilV